MTEQLREIGQRLSSLRKLMDLSEEDFAEKMSVSVQDLQEFEQGKRDFSFSFLHNAAKELSVDVIDIMSGESPRLSSCCLVRNGQGLSLDRRAAYSYKHLAYTFRNKQADPFLVTVQPKDDEKTVLHSHGGQEFNYMVSGSMMFYLGEITYTLSEGDSVYFDSGIPHAMKALNGAPASFLAIVLNEEGQVAK